ncbi:MAG TPA: helix-turn-helix domain-containing protein [Acidimicrobiales bacterium]|nr:helix-turn-helix domain-containing protein [Acidimicrobiales bacterium]
MAVAVGDGLTPFEFGVACEVFGYDRSDLVVPWYRFAVCSPGGRPVRTETGFSIGGLCPLEELSRADTIIVPPSAEAAWHRDELLGLLRHAHRRGARIVSLCTGAFALAAAGLLDGRRATTHWRHVEEFARRFPRVTLDPAVLYVDEGDLLTSAGSAASIDLCLYLLRLDHGAEVANAVARRMVVPPHRDGGQSQFIEVPLRAVDPESLFADTLVWAQEHLDEPLTVAELAARSAMSPRNFARRFRQATGTTPYHWLLNQRILLAQRLLETTDLAVDVVAGRCGIGDAANLRDHFRRVVGTSPSSYRQTFRHLAS